MVNYIIVSTFNQIPPELGYFAHLIELWPSNLNHGWRDVIIDCLDCVVEYYELYFV